MKLFTSKLAVTALLVLTTSVSANELVKPEIVDNKSAIQTQVELDIAASMKAMTIDLNTDNTAQQPLIASQSKETANKEAIVKAESIAE